GAERELPDLLARRVAAERRRCGACHARVCRGFQNRHAAFGTVSGVRPCLQYRPWRAGAADAVDAGLFRRRAAVDHDWLPDLRLRPRRNDGDLSQLLHRRNARADAAEIERDLRANAPRLSRGKSGCRFFLATNAERVCAEIMFKQGARTPRWPTIPTTKQKTLRKNVSTRRLKEGTSPRAR